MSANVSVRAYTLPYQVVAVCTVRRSKDSRCDCEKKRMKNRQRWRIELFRNSYPITAPFRFSELAAIYFLRATIGKDGARRKKDINLPSVSLAMIVYHLIAAYGV